MTIDHDGRHEDYDDPDCHNVTLNKSRAAMMDAVAAAVERSNISSNKEKRISLPFLHSTFL